jgi:hypothetical protein
MQFFTHLKRMTKFRQMYGVVIPKQLHLYLDGQVYHLPTIISIDQVTAPGISTANSKDVLYYGTKSGVVK